MGLLRQIPLLECVHCLDCVRWAWKRGLRTGGQDSERWGSASWQEFEPVPHLCRLIRSVYEDDIRKPKWAPPGGYGINPECILKKVTHKQSGGRAPPYVLYMDHENCDIVLAIRGLNMAKGSDYAILCDNKPGQVMLDGGFVHNGLLRSATWIMDNEGDRIKELIKEYPNYTLTFTGHSLGSGIAALLALIVVCNRDLLGEITRNRIRCFALAPVRCMSLDLAVRYADIINSVVLQDDFLPRTAEPLEDIFTSVFCLPCLPCGKYLIDTYIPDEMLLADPQRLYAPGRLYHIVERKFCRCGRFPPVVKTDVPVEGRFEHVIISCNAASDHAIIWIERESQKALDLMIERERALEIPSEQKMQRQQALANEHDKEYKAAIERTATLRMAQAYSPSYGTFDNNDNERTELLIEHGENFSEKSEIGEPSVTTKRKSKWDEVINKLIKKR